MSGFGGGSSLPPIHGPGGGGFGGGNGGNNGGTMQYGNPGFQPASISPPQYSPVASPNVQSPAHSLQQPLPQQQMGGGPGFSTSSSNLALQSMPSGSVPQMGGGGQGGFMPPMMQQQFGNQPGVQMGQMGQMGPFNGGGGGGQMMGGGFGPNGQMMGAMSPQQQVYGNGGGYNSMNANSMNANQMGMAMGYNGFQKPPRGGMPGPWRTGLCGLDDDCFTSLVGCCTPGLMYGENYQKIYGYGFCCACAMYTAFPCFACCYANETRAELRRKYNLQEEPCGDCCIHLFCSSCAVCQEARELRIRERWI